MSVFSKENLGEALVYPTASPAVDDALLGEGFADALRGEFNGITAPPEQYDQAARIAAVCKEVYDSIPKRMALSDLLRETHAKLLEAYGEVVSEQARDMLITSKLAEILREVATYAVEQYTRRTGERWEWKDDPEPEPEEATMHFALDEKGNVTF